MKKLLTILLLSVTCLQLNAQSYRFNFAEGMIRIEWQVMHHYLNRNVSPMLIRRASAGLLIERLERNIQ